MRFNSLARIALFCCFWLAGLTWGTPPTEPAPTDDGLLFEAIPIPSGLTVAQARSRVLYVLSCSDWTVQSAGPDFVRASILHSGWIVDLTFRIDEKSIQMLHKTTRDGKPAIHASWMKRLSVGINARLRQKP